MNIFKWILNLITGASKKVIEYYAFGRDFANEVKKYENKPLGEAIEMAISAIVKATPNKIDDAVWAIVRTFVKDMNWSGLKLSERNEDSKAVVLQNINGIAAKAKSDGKLTIQETSTVAYPFYDRSLSKVRPAKEHGG